MLRNHSISTGNADRYWLRRRRRRLRYRAYIKRSARRLWRPTKIRIGHWCGSPYMRTCPSSPRHYLDGAKLILVELFIDATLWTCTTISLKPVCWLREDHAKFYCKEAVSNTEDPTGINGCERVEQADEKPGVTIILVLRRFKRRGGEEIHRLPPKIVKEICVMFHVEHRAKNLCHLWYSYSKRETSLSNRHFFSFAHIDRYRKAVSVERSDGSAFSKPKYTTKKYHITSATYLWTHKRPQKDH